MKRAFSFAPFLFALAGAAAAQSVAPPVASTPTASAVAASLTMDEIVDRANKLFRGDSSHARFTMTVERPDWKRTLDIESWNRGREKAFILVHAPAKDEGTATLRRGPEMWLWLPRVERVIKVPPTMMHSAWMGSDFTYEDVVKADSVFRDYTHKLLERHPDPAGGRELVTIEADPKPDAPVVWGKVILECAVYPGGDVIGVNEDDYNERGELIRTILLSDVGMMGGKLVPRRLECLPRTKPGQKTIIQYQDIVFDAPIPESTFSLERLQRNQE